LIAIYAY